MLNFEYHMLNEKDCFLLAFEKFSLALQLRPTDPASQTMQSRILALNPEELPEDWDGSVTLRSK